LSLYFWYTIFDPNTSLHALSSCALTGDAFSCPTAGPGHLHQARQYGRSGEPTARPDEGFIFHRRTCGTLRLRLSQSHVVLMTKLRNREIMGPDTIER
jgi:hypothetical protein